MGANLQYKDSVFSWLFSDPDILRELYAALEGVALPDDAPITINTLDNVLYMDRVNDISFEIGDRVVVLIEHQSTLNPNMPLRLLMYIARLYEKIIDRKKMYTSSLTRLPTPEFFVLYNGKAPYPDEKVLRLSNAFMDAGGLLPPGVPALELSAKVLNINQRHNTDKLHKSRTLEEYSAFIDRVRREEAKGLAREDAMKRAIVWCIEHNVLKNFLETNSSEVINMLLAEWNLDDALAVRWEEGREKGKVEGKTEGKVEGKVELLVRLLTRRFGPLPGWAETRVKQAKNPQLEEWSDRVLDASRLTEVIGAPDTH
jgi:hypothetical protein